MPHAGHKVRGKARKIASASGSQIPPALGQPFTVSASLAPKPPAKASSGVHSAEASNASSAVEADCETGSVQPAGQLLSVPETGLTTSLGGAVLEVRGGTAVLEGPGGIPNGSTGRCGPRHRANRHYRALRPADLVRPQSRFAGELDRRLGSLRPARQEQSRTFSRAVAETYPTSGTAGVLMAPPRTRRAEITCRQWLDKQVADRRARPA